MESLNSSQQIQQVPGLEEQITPLEQQTTVITPTDADVDKRKPGSRSQRHLLPKVLVGVLLGSGAIASGVYGYRAWQYAQRYQETDNAYVSANIYPVTSRIAGTVTEVAVNDNQTVSPEMMLVKLDPRDYEVSLSQSKADLELAKQQAALAQENLKKVLTINIPEPEPANKNTKAKPGASGNKILPAEQAMNQQKELNQQQYKTAQAAITQKQAEVKQAELQLSYTNITALAAGKIGNKNVQVGQRVQPGQTLLTVVQPNPWIIANFRETQLEKIQPEQKVEMKIAAFPSRKFRGTVESMSATSFGRFALSPQENATGNSTKSSDVQRIPVKITFEPESLQGYESRMTPGMSAVVTVDTK
jgi:membrane fusion protein, multidrug efflux system